MQEEPAKPNISMMSSLFWLQRWYQRAATPKGFAIPPFPLKSPFLTHTLPVLQLVAGLAAQLLQAAEGAHGVDTVLSPLAGVSLCHTLVDVCEREGTHQCHRLLRHLPLPALMEGAGSPDERQSMQLQCSDGRCF